MRYLVLDILILVNFTVAFLITINEWRDLLNDKSMQKVWDNLELCTMSIRKMVIVLAFGLFFLLLNLWILMAIISPVQFFDKALNGVKVLRKAVIK